MARGLRQKSKAIDEAMPLNSEIVDKALAELDSVNTVEEPKVVKPQLKVGLVSASLNVRQEPSTDSPILGVLNANTQVKITEEINGFGKLADRDGWVMLKFISL